MNNNTSHVFIFSVDQKGLDNTTARHSVRLKLRDDDVSYIRAEGSYKGTPEISYVLPTDFNSLEDTRTYVLGLAKTHGQECVLYADNERQAFLVFPDGRPDESIGQLVSSVDKPDVDGYTLVDGVYYFVSASRSETK